MIFYRKPMALSVVGIVLSILGVSAGSALTPLFVLFGIVFTLLLAGFAFYNVAVQVGMSFGLLGIVKVKGNRKRNRDDDDYDD